MREAKLSFALGEPQYGRMKGFPPQASVYLSVKLVHPLFLVSPLPGQVGGETMQDSEAILCVCEAEDSHISP